MTKIYTVKDIFSVWRKWEKRHHENMNTSEWQTCSALLSACFEVVDEEVGREKMASITKKGGFMRIPLGVSSMQALVALSKATKVTPINDTEAENENK